MDTVTAAWTEELHPRAPAGDPTGGQFAPPSDEKSKQEDKKYAGSNMVYDPRKDRGPGYGVKGGDKRVRLLQEALNKLGLRDSKGNKLDVDGMLGPLTTQSIKAAQRRLGLKPDGVVTPKLLKQLATAKTLNPVKKQLPLPKKAVSAEDVVTLARERDVNQPGSGSGHQLREYWVHGPGAVKIGWGTDGSFARCVANLGKHVKDPQGLCAEYHKAATGQWPAEKGVPSGGDVEAFHGRTKHDGDCPPDHHRMPDGECMADEEMESYTAAAEKEPYGDVKYADSGYQADGVKRYPIDTEEHVRAAWSYINVPKNASKYSTEDLQKVKTRIRAAMKRFGIGASEGDDDSVTSATGSRYGSSGKNGASLMPWRIEKQNGEFVIVADADGTVLESFADRSQAVSLLRRLYAGHVKNTAALVAAAEAEAATVVAEVEESVRTAPWAGVLTVEGIESGDGRMFGAQGLSWDEPPLPLMWQKETSHGGDTDKSVRVGSIQKIWREPDASGRADVFLIKGEGTLDLDNPDGAEVHRRMVNKDMRGNSVDVDSIKGADVELIFPEVGESGGTESLLNQAFAQPELTIYRKGRIRATTMVEIPAFTEARLELVDTGTVTASDECQECQQVVVEDADGQRLAALTAATAVVEIPDLPPREWFEEPTDVSIDGALTVTAEGRLYGFVAPAGVRHRSFSQRAQYVPLGRVDYDRYHGGETIVADGGRVSTGNITMDCGHATTRIKLTGAQAAEHYDNTCSLIATARVGENERGVWIAGALLPDVDASAVRRVMACRLSGDWRTHLDRPGWREFVAALLVPVPGFAMERTAAPSVEITEGQIVASSVPVRLVVNDQPISMRSAQRERVAALTQRVGRDLGSRRATVVARVRPHRVAALAERVRVFHGTHDQSTHGDRDGSGGGGTPLAVPAGA